MAKFLKVMVVILFLVCAAALTFGVMLFLKRELLKGRTQRLEKAIKEFDAVIEMEPGTMDVKPEDIEIDISPCEEGVLELPETVEFNDFWTSYKYDLEVQAPKSYVSTSSRNKELMSYFVTDAAGNKRIKGPGTMDNVLTELLKEAEEQYGILNETRQQLTDLRAELKNVIQKHNDKMMDHRRALIKIKQLEDEIVQLKARIEELENKVAELEAQIAPLKDQIAEQERTIADLEEQIGEKDREIERLNKIVGEKPTEGEGEQVFRGQLEPGVKGQVVLVNQEWQFCVFKMDDSFFSEITEDDPDREIPQMDLWVKRPGKKAQQIVTKIRMLTVKRAEKMATADVLTDWQQLPLQVGDVVFFQ